MEVLLHPSVDADIYTVAIAMIDLFLAYGLTWTLVQFLRRKWDLSKVLLSVVLTLVWEGAVLYQSFTESSSPEILMLMVGILATMILILSGIGLMLSIALMKKNGKKYLGYFRYSIQHTVGMTLVTMFSIVLYRILLGTGNLFVFTLIMIGLWFGLSKLFSHGWFGEDHK